MIKYIKQDTEQAKEVIKQLKENGGYCPCALERNSDTKCMCTTFRTGQQCDEGLCHCGLYLRVKT